MSQAYTNAIAKGLMKLLFEELDKRDARIAALEARPSFVDRGVWKQGEVYKTGNAVTWGGSLWIAQTGTMAKPDSPDSGWRLAVKKGRDGKDAR